MKYPGHRLVAGTPSWAVGTTIERAIMRQIGSVTEGTSSIPSPRPYVRAFRAYCTNRAGTDAARYAYFLIKPYLGFPVGLREPVGDRLTLGRRNGYLPPCYQALKTGGLDRCSGERMSVSQALAGAHVGVAAAPPVSIASCRGIRGRRCSPAGSSEPGHHCGPNAGGFTA